MNERTIRKLRDLGESLLAAEESVNNSPVEPNLEAFDNPATSGKVAEARALIAGMNREEKGELLRWMQE